jgi:hypothetical protein
MKALFAGALAVLFAAFPALAQPYNPAGVNGRASALRSAYQSYGAVTPFGVPAADRNGSGRMSAARAAAIHTCSGEAAKYVEYTWGDFEIQIYRSCMAQHGQVE